jgi:hypothetical protein
MFPALRRQVPRVPVDNLVTSSVGDGVWSVAGTGDMATVGASTRAGAFSAAGVGGINWISSPAGVISAAGVGAASFVGGSTVSRSATMAGVGAASFVGASTREAVWSAAGTSEMTASTPVDSDGSMLLVMGVG